MDQEQILTILKTSSVILTGVLGIMGALGKFSREDGKLNKAGYVLIFVITIFTVMSVSITLIEARKDRSDALEQVSRMEGLLREVSRVGDPITQLQATFWVEMPPTIDIVEKYLTRLDKAIASREQQLQDLFPRSKDLKVIATGPNGEFLDVEVDNASSYWPKGDEKTIGDVAKFFKFTVYIRKEPIKPELFKPVISAHPEFSDWIATSFPKYLKEDKHHNKILMDYQNKKLYIFGSAEYDRTFWKTNGKINSVQDLYGSQLFFLPPDSSDLELPASLKKLENPLRKAIFRSLKIKTIVLKFSSGREIWIDGDKIKTTKFQDGFPVFSIVLPNTENELLDLRRNSSVESKLEEGLSRLPH